MKLVKENLTGEVLGELVEIEQIDNPTLQLFYKPFVEEHGFIAYKDKIDKGYNLRSLLEVQIEEVAE